MALVRDEFSNAEAFLAARPAVRVVDLLLPDLCGVLRGKRIDRSDLPGIYQRGMFLPGSMFALDVLGGTIQSTGLGFDEGDADRACVPIPNTLSPRPGWAPPSRSSRCRCSTTTAGRSTATRATCSVPCSTATPRAAGSR